MKNADRICKATELDKDFAAQLLALDRIERKFGRILYGLTGQHPELEKIASDWNQLRKEQKDFFTMLIKLTADENRQESRKS